MARAGMRSRASETLISLLVSRKALSFPACFSLFLFWLSWGLSPFTSTSLWKGPTKVFGFWPLSLFVLLSCPYIYQFSYLFSTGAFGRCLDSQYRTCAVRYLPHRYPCPSPVLVPPWAFRVNFNPHFYLFQPYSDAFFFHSPPHLLAALHCCHCCLVSYGYVQGPGPFSSNLIL